MSTVTISPSVFPGLLLPWPLEADVDASTVGQVSAVAGRPLPSEDAVGRTPGLRLAASGAQSATVHIATQRAGNVGRATYRCRRTVAGVTDDRWRGADLPNVLRGFDGIGWDSGVVQRYPHAVTLPDDTQVVVYAQRPDLVSTWTIRVRVWDPATETYGSAVTLASGLDASHAPWPWLLPIPDPQNRHATPLLVCGWWAIDDSVAYGNIDTAISRDGGATWTTYAQGVLDADLSTAGTTFGRVRACMVGAQVAMWVHLTKSSGVYETITQYASSSMAAGFDTVGVVGDQLDPTGWPDACSVGPYGVLIWTRDTTGQIATVSNAFVLVATAQATFASGAAVTGSTTTDTITFAAPACCARPDGKVAIVWTAASSNTRPGLSALYNPISKTATSLYLNVGSWFSDGKATATEYPFDLAATHYRGQVRVYSTIESGTSTYKNKLTRLDLGGLSTATMPGLQNTTATFDQAYAWEQTYIPGALPTGYTGWTATGAGADNITTTPGRHRITTTANQRYYERSPASAPSGASKQIFGAWRIWRVSGGSVSAREIVVGLRYAFAGTGYQVEVRCSSTQIRSFDVNAGTTLSTATADVAGGIEVLMALSGSGKVTIYYRDLGTDEDANFAALEEQTSATDDAGVGGTVCSYYYGSLSVSTATGEYIPLGQQIITTYGRDDWATAASNPSTLRGIPYGDGSYALAGVTLAATGGPTVSGDAWAATPDATYPIRHLIPNQDPESTAEIQGGHRTSARDAASGWRGSAPSGRLAFRWRGSRNRFAPAATAFHEEFLNVPSYTAQGYNEDSASWVTLGTVNKYKTVRFTRTNANSPRIKVDTGNTSTDEPYLYAGELTGGWVRFVTSGDIRPIVWNEEGRWSADGAHGLPFIDLDPDSIDGTEDTTGSLEIWYPRSTAVFYHLPTEKYSKYALYWSGAQSTYTGDIRANIIAIGQVEPLALARDRGVVQALSDPSDLTTHRSGLRIGVRRELAPRRIVTVPLIAPQAQADLLDPSSPRPYKLSSSSSMPLAGTMGDGYGRTRGAWTRQGGRQWPVVYIPRLTRGPSDAYTLLGLESAGLYGRMTTAPRFVDQYGRDTGNVWGAVYIGENLTFEEEL